MDNESRITLTEEQAEKFVKLHTESDSTAYSYLLNIVENELKIKDNNNSETIYDLFNAVLELNGMVAMGETFDGVFAEHYEEIHELYMTMQNELQNCFTNDFDKYYKKYW